MAEPPKHVDSSEKLSKNLAHLDATALTRYQQKLIVDGISIPDPYSISKWDDDVGKWPTVSFGDIYNYLINTPGLYTQESLKAYKSLDGYNYFESGHVHEVLFNDVSSDTSACLLKAKVTPSQRATGKPHESWVCIHKEKGYVISAHCTCKAGLGEACSHIAALLFKMERAALYGLNNESKTSQGCIWNRHYRKKVTPQLMVEMDFSKGKRQSKKRRLDRLDRVEEPEEEEFDEDESLRQLKLVNPRACILTKGDSDTDSASDDEELPPLLNRFHEEEYADLSEVYIDLKEKCQRFVKDFVVSEMQAKNLETITTGQSKSLIWHRHRHGRITATTAHDIKVRKETTPKTAILKKVMKYDTVNLSKIEAVAFGNKYESVARDKYKDQLTKQHIEFGVRECGLFVDNTFPLFAATPDGVRSCKCCGVGLLEIKCSFKHQHEQINEIKDPQFYLDENMALKTSHRYYTQVQFQMYVCGRTFCDFVVFTRKGIVVTTIPYNPEFVNELIPKCTKFALDDLVPEIIQQKLNQ